MVNMIAGLLIFAGILETNAEALHKVAALLVEKEEIKGEDVYRIVGVMKGGITA